ncbi:MAG: aldo/keto reductase [Bifidobacteriaceae bacterium]|jgi:aryl-alcohol dehydrogenase-like predicted oxidoreductase|nr:aldo/keto reductase [Bifidobacteriaceae bacterium]
MEYRALGGTGLKVSALSLGSYHIYDRLSIDDAAELLRAACDAGINWFDVGHYTSAAHPETRVSTTDIRFGWAKDLAGVKREDYVHTEKLWYGGPRPSFKAQFAESLPRAQVDYADIAIYNPDTAYYFKTPVDMKDIVTQMAGLVEAGLTRFWGINHAFPTEVREACEFAAAEGMPLPSLMQVPYSAIARDMAEDASLIPILEEYGLAIQASNTLAVGVLAGRLPAQATRTVGQEWLTEFAESVLAEFDAIARSVGASKAQLAIAFALSNERVASVLSGVSSPAQLADNIGALDLLARIGADGVRAALKELPQHPKQAQVGDLADS